MAEAPPSDLVVEILHNRGDDTHTDWSVGSGYYVGANLVLTAAHNVDGLGEVLVRVHGTQEYSAKVLLQGDRDLVDLALLEVPTRSMTVPHLRYGAVDRTVMARIEQCCAVGFPRLKERAKSPKPERRSAQVDGYIPTADNLDQPQLTLLVTRYPRSDPNSNWDKSEWAGMSGAVVFAGNNVVVGVVTEHHLPEGENSLTVVPITVLDQLPDTEAAQWWTLLGMERGAYVQLPNPASGTPEAAINLTVAEGRYRQQAIGAYRSLRPSSLTPLPTSAEEAGAANHVLLQTTSRMKERLAWQPPFQSVSHIFISGLAISSSVDNSSILSNAGAVLLSAPCIYISHNAFKDQKAKKVLKALTKTLIEAGFVVLLDKKRPPFDDEWRKQIYVVKHGVGFSRKSGFGTARCCFIKAELFQDSMHLRRALRHNGMEQKHEQWMRRATP